MYPGPLKEVDFWTERAANLNSIHQQLSSERVKKVAKILELVKSTYYPAFNRCVGWLSLCQSRFQPYLIVHVYISGWRFPHSNTCSIALSLFQSCVESICNTLQALEGRQHSVPRSQ